jgi:hypothetical protein
MLTKRGIRKFCYDAVGIFLWSEDNVLVEKQGPYYTITLENARAPKHLIKRVWDQHITGTKYESKKLQLDIR